MSQRFVVIIDWRPDLAGGQIEVFGTWRSRKTAQKALDAWLKRVPAEHLRDCEPITEIKVLGGNEGYDFARSQKRVASQITIEPTEERP